MQCDMAAAWSETSLFNNSWRLIRFIRKRFVRALIFGIRQNEVKAKPPVSLRLFPPVQILRVPHELSPPFAFKPVLSCRAVALRFSISSRVRGQSVFSRRERARSASNLPPV